MIAPRVRRVDEIGVSRRAGRKVRAPDPPSPHDTHVPVGLRRTRRSSCRLLAGVERRRGAAYSLTAGHREVRIPGDAKASIQGVSRRKQGDESHRDETSAHRPGLLCADRDSGGGETRQSLRGARPNRSRIEPLQREGQELLAPTEDTSVSGRVRSLHLRAQARRDDPVRKDRAREMITASRFGLCPGCGGTELGLQVRSLLSRAALLDDRRSRRAAFFSLCT